MFRPIKQYAKMCKRHWKIISLVCVVFSIALWKYSTKWLYIREGAKGCCNVNKARVNSIVIDNRQRLGPLLKKASGQSSKVAAIKKKIKELQDDMKKTADTATNETKSIGKPT
jgi:hypothetical protein